MATTDAIAGVSHAIARVLERSARPLGLKDAQVKVVTAEAFQAGAFPAANALGVSIYLHRVALNPSYRGRVPQEVDGKRFKPSLALDLYYLVSAWAGDASTQHSLLGWSLRALADVGTLARGLLNEIDAKNQPFRLGESVELVCDPLPADQWSQLYELLKPAWPPSVLFVARPVVIDSARTLDDDKGLVQERSLNFAPHVDEGVTT